jgi:hypothetical protein
MNCDIDDAGGMLGKVGLPELPFANGFMDMEAFNVLARLVPADKIADMFMAYCRVAEASARVAELQAGSITGSSEASGSVPGPPRSEVSVNSSVSSARARRRARWKANRAKASRVSDSEVSEVESSITRSSEGSGMLGASVRTGYCYLGVFRLEYRARASDELGANPSFSRLLSMPEGWFLQSLSKLFVSRKSEGVYHLGNVGFSADSCFHAVVMKAVSGGVLPASGSIAARYCSSDSQVFHLDKAPKWHDVLGMADSAWDSSGTCLFCSSAKDFTSDPGSWIKVVREGYKVKYDEQSSRNCLLVSGVCLGVVDYGDEVLLCRFTSVNCRVLASEYKQYQYCNIHRGAVSACDCFRNDGFVGWSRAKVGMPLIGCGYCDCKYRFGPSKILGLSTVVVPDMVARASR